MDSNAKFQCTKPSSSSASVFGYCFGTPYDDENIDKTMTIYISSVHESNLSTKPLSLNNYENGDNDNIHLGNPTSNYAKPASPHSMGKDSLPASRTNSPLPPSIPLPTHVIVEIVMEKFRGASVLSSVNFSNPSSSNEPITTTDQWIWVSPKKRFRSMSTSSVGKPSLLKPPTIPKVTIVDSVMTPKNLGSPPTCAPPT
ncbi:hypothetical protein Cgig2_027433 [Carnegiea gigantea]|uniref:Uncharacterized protein n=1 Tax=Carnegiea gigantea TaxID=171969 RepID=A0A9Q1Q7Z8_9CARY|nr:hypothetical protein Cgig2_027433 [Carnegiea gigantea]